MSKLNNVLDRVDTELESSLERLFALLRIESISTDPAFAGQCAATAKVLADDLQNIGFDARVVPTTGHPMVVAHHEGPDGAPHVLFYGHYDVQPVDPLELWDRPPFEPEIIEMPDGSKRLLGRGTSDDKGQLMTFVEACRAWKMETGSLPIKVSILFEGEEESGSPSLLPFLEANKEELQADFVLVCDTNMWDPKTPAIATALRGLVGEEVTIHAANRDLHSGYYGSAAANPIHALSKIVGDLHDDEGRVTLEGFYDAVPETPDDILKQWGELGFSEEEFLGEIGLSVPAGEGGRSVLEQVWTRPTCEVNGIYGGYSGEGSKTVIPAQASAKISFRLVGDQDPESIRKSFRKFVNERLPKDCNASFKDHGGSPAVHLDYNMPELQKAANALEDEWNHKTALIAMGGSIPIVGDFKSIFDMNSLLIGFRAWR